jgi:hypothetical protein
MRGHWNSHILNILPSIAAYHTGKGARTIYNMRFVAFPATEYDEVLSGYQPGQMVER